MYSDKEGLATLAKHQLQEFADCYDRKVAVKLLENAELDATRFKTISHERDVTLHALEQCSTQQDFDDMQKRAEEAEAQLSSYKQRVEQAERMQQKASTSP